MAGLGYLPPVVAQLAADATDFVKKIEEAKALLADFAKSNTKAHLGADTAPLAADLTTAKVGLLDFARQVSRAKLGADAAPFWADIMALKAELAAMSPVDLRVDANLAGVMARLAALQGALALGQVGQLAGGGGGGEGAALGAAAGGAAAGGGGRKGGLLGMLGWGSGILGMAGVGSALSLAGGGFEHLLMTILGLAGSATGGLLGGGLIGLGAAGTIGVGGGSDAAVMSSTIADTKTLYQAYNNLATAQAVYGASSYQAAIAQAQLNAQLKVLGGGVGVKAEQQLAQSTIALNQFWDAATQAARVQAVGILTQVETLARTFIPLVANAAQKNLAIINTSLKPLFAWLQGPQGIGIFQHLEAVFAQNLPTAMHAFTQGVELLLKTINVASNYTGGFTRALDRFLTRLNSPAGFARWTKDIHTLIGLFHIWGAFIVILGKDMADVFMQSAGLGTSIIGTLTQMLTRLHAWLNTGKGKSSLSALFQAHKQEIIAILQLLPALAPLATIYLALAVPLTKLATGLVNLVNALLHAPVIGPWLAWGAAIGIMFQKMQVAAITAFVKTQVAAETSATRVAVSWTVNAAKVVASWLATAATQIARVAVVAAANVAGAAVAAAAWIAANALMLAGIGLVVAAVIAAVVLIVSHWSQIKAFMAGLWKGVETVAGAAFRLITNAGLGALNWLRSNWPLLLGILGGPFGLAVAVIATHFNQIRNAARALIGDFIYIGRQIMQGLANGILGALGVVKNALQHIVGVIRSIPVIGGLIGSPSPYFTKVGQAIGEGTRIGLERSTDQALAAMAHLSAGIRATPMGPPPALVGGGRLAMAGAGAGVTINAPVTVQVSGATGATPQGIGDAVARQMRAELDRVLRQLQGGVYANPSQ